MNRAIIADCKAFINEGDLHGLQDYYTQIQNSSFDYDPGWAHIYQQVYLHACLKKKEGIADWLTTVYESFDLITKTALRQVFSYGRYLLAK